MPVNVPEFEPKLEFLFAKSAERGGAIRNRQQLGAALGVAQSTITSYIRGTDMAPPDRMPAHQAGALCRAVQRSLL